MTRFGSITLATRVASRESQRRLTGSSGWYHTWTRIKYATIQVNRCVKLVFSTSRSQHQPPAKQPLLTEQESSEHNATDFWNERLQMLIWISKFSCTSWTETVKSRVYSIYSNSTRTSVSWFVKSPSRDSFHTQSRYRLPQLLFHNPSQILSLCLTPLTFHVNKQLQDGE
jgi:hypothetical protein